MPLDLRVGSVHLHVGREADQADRSPALAEVDHDSVGLDKAVGTAPTALVTVPPPATAAFVAAPAAGLRPDPGPTPTPALPADPLRWQYGWNRNAVWTPRAGETNAFATLRNLAKLCWEIFACKETRKEQLQSLDWDIVPRDKAGKSDAAAIAKVREFFRKPDGETAFRTWLGMAIEDVLVIDALSVYRRKTRGGAFYGLEIIDGATVLPLIDGNGRTPKPPQIAYRQVVWGQPVKGGDCTTDELYYKPRVAAVNSPYGTSPTEAVILAVNASLARRMFDLQYYSEGNVPEGFATLPANWTAEQIATFEEHFNSMTAGFTPNRSRIKFLPDGTGNKFVQFKDRDHDASFDEFLVKVACAVFAVPPAEIGFTNDVNKSTSKTQQDIAYRRGVKPLCNFFKDFFDEVIAFDLGRPELEFTWAGGESEDRYRQAQIDDLEIRNGKVSIDECRVRDGQPMIGMGPAVYLPTGPVFIEQLVRGVDEDPTTTDPAAPAAPAGPATLGECTPAPEPVTAKPDAEAAHAEGARAESGQDKSAEETDLRKWRTVAIKAVKAGKPVKPFISDAIAPGLQAVLKTALAEARTVPAVVGAFEAVEKARATVLQQQRLERKVRRVAADFFHRQGAALVEHLTEAQS